MSTSLLSSQVETLLCPGMEELGFCCCVALSGGGGGGGGIDDDGGGVAILACIWHGGQQVVTDAAVAVGLIRMSRA